MTLAVGDMAPETLFAIADGETLSIAKWRGKPVILYFYPKDDTSGCTREAQDFTALASAFSDLGAVVIGVSRDSLASHNKFAAKHNLDVILASDEEGSLCDAFGVWVEKSMYGKKYMGIERATFLIGNDGKIASIWRKVKVPGHAEAVLTAAQSL